MSYQQLLSQYADKMNRARAHAEDVNAENREMKANSLEKAFEHITGPIQQGSEGVAALSGAYMAGRKVYKKVLQNRAAKAKAKADSNENTEGDSNSSSTNAADGEGSGAPSGGGEGGATGGQGADSAATRAPTGETDDPAPTSVSEAGTEGASAGPSDTLSSIPEEPTVVGGARTQDRVFSEAQESDPAGISDQGAARQATQRANTATDEAPNSSGTQGTGAEAEPAPAGEGTQVTTQPAQAAEGDTLAGTGRTTAADLTSSPGSADPFSSPRTLAQTSEGAETAEDSTSLLSRAQGAISSARNAIQGAGNGIKNAVNGAKSALAGAGEDAGATLGEGAADLAASQSLDWLGPIGLGIGAIGGLVDLFENLFGKPKTAEEMSGPLQTGTAAGIDVGALKSKAPAQVAV